MLNSLILPVENLHLYLKIILVRTNFIQRKFHKQTLAGSILKKLKKLKRNYEKNNNYRDYSEDI
jgi:hypothetical protein